MPSWLYAQPDRHGDIGKRAVAIVPVKRARIRIVRDIHIHPAVIVEIERADAQAVRAARPGDAGRLGDVSERAVSSVAIEEILPAAKARRPARDRHAFVAAQARLRDGGIGQVEVDVVGGKQIEPAVAIEIQEGAPGAPSRSRADEARRARDLVEGPVAAIAIEPVLTPVRHEEVVVSVVVVVAGAGPLSPSRVHEARLRRHVLERSVAPVAIEMARRLLPFREAFERRAVDDEDVEPVVAVVIEDGDAAAGGLEEIAIGLLTAEYGLCGQSRGFRHFHE